MFATEKTKERIVRLLEQSGVSFEKVSSEEAANFLIENGVGISPIEVAEQWHNDIENPLEPLKVASALQSEILKFEIRKEQSPQDISILDYTIIACLMKHLEDTDKKSK